jgi:hypothetical protein
MQRSGYVPVLLSPQAAPSYAKTSAKRLNVSHPSFSLQVRRHRTTPSWRHQTLKVIQEQSHVDEGGAEAVDIEDDDDVGG